jgi:hypothetical protein
MLEYRNFCNDIWQLCGDNRKRKRVLRLIELTAEDTEYFEIKILDWKFVYKKKCFDYFKLIGLNP